MKHLKGVIIPDGLPNVILGLTLVEATTQTLLWIFNYFWPVVVIYDFPATVMI